MDVNPSLFIMAASQNDASFQFDKKDDGDNQIRAKSTNPVTTWFLQKTPNHSCHVHSSDTIQDIYNSRMGLDPALQATVDAIQEKYHGNATTYNVVDDMQQMPFSDPDIKDLFVTRVKNYLANHNGNKRQFDKTIAARPVESQIPSPPHRTSNTIRTQFQNLQDLQEYLCIPPTRQIWENYFFRIPPSIL
jgi:hypothetical protein